MIKNLLMTLLLFGVIAGCGKGFEYPKHETIVREELVCDNDTKQKRHDFILDCIKNANPKSDEEPEDWIKDCKYMAENTWCDKRQMEIKRVIRCHGCGWETVSKEVTGEKK